MTASAPLVGCHSRVSSITATAITDEHYITRYIVNKRHTVARVRFITADHLEACLPDYAQLHNANCDWVSEQHDAFYQQAVMHPRVEVFLDEFRSRVGWYLRHKVKGGGKFDTFTDDASAGGFADFMGLIVPDRAVGLRERRTIRLPMLHNVYYVK